MDPRLRRSSAASLREPNFSSPVDRLHRQARQSILFEERESPVFRDDLFSSPHLSRTKPLGRTGTTETLVSPTEPHPGQRLPAPPGGWTPGSTQERHELTEIFPILDPVVSKRSSFTLKSSPVTLELPLDVNAIEAQPSDFAVASGARYPRPNWLQHFLNFFPRSPGLKPGAVSGLRVASAAATAHAKATVHHQSYLHKRRQQVYITEYEAGESLQPKRIPVTLNHVSGLQHYLLEASKPRFKAPSLRVIYVQNNEEAMDFLTNIFHLDHASFEKFEGSFKDWIHERKSHRDSSRTTISWKPSYDVTRDIVCTVFGLDFGSGLAGIQAASNTALPGKRSPDPRISITGQSALRPQRISVYVQRTLDGFPQAGKMGVFNTTTSEKWKCAHQNTILIYDNSNDDCEETIQGPALLDLQWNAGTTRMQNSETALIKTLEDILLYIFHKVLRAWREQLSLLSMQYTELEDRVYGQPSDDSHATELWAMSKYLWGIAKLVNRHSNLIEDVQENFNQFAERGTDCEWLEDLSRDFRQISITIQEDYIRPTEHMIDLVRQPARFTLFKLMRDFADIEGIHADV